MARTKEERLSGYDLDLAVLRACEAYDLALCGIVLGSSALAGLCPAEKAQRASFAMHVRERLTAPRG